jgi:hypothetical protein
MSSKMGILLNRLWAGHNISLNEVRGVKKKKCVSKLDISLFWWRRRRGSEGRMWLPTLVGYCTNRWDNSIKTFLSVFQELKREILFFFFISFVFVFFSNSDG